MQDDKNTIEDDFEDLDFEDLDNEDDFDDESWDDFDDEGTSEAEVQSPPDSSDSASDAPAPVKKKSFLQKNFNLIVILIAVVGGGGFIFSQLGGSPANTPPEAPADLAAQQVPDSADTAITAPTEIPELSDENLPPMPAPIENASADIALSDTPDLSFELDDSMPAEAPALMDTELQAEQQVADDVLTPLPDLSDSGDLQPLENLDVAVNEEAPAAEITTPDLAETDIAAIEDLSVMDAPEEEPVIEDIQVIEPPAEDITDAVLPETEVDVQVDEATTEQSVLIEELNAKIAEKDKALDSAAQENTDISQKLEAANTEIESLKAMVDELKNEMESLKTAAVETPVKAAQPSAAPEKEAAPEKQPEAPQPVEKQEKVEEPTAKEAPAAVQWVLRSASPGRATISPKDNNDLRQVEVGNTVPGLGKIQSISIENNRWVVRGTKSTVSQ